MKKNTIQLTKGKTAIVDEDDYPELSKHSWYYNGEYAVRTFPVRKNGRKYNKVIRMHRVIMDAVSSVQVDHINRDKLDNRKTNLRICTHHQNSQNIGVRIDNTSGYKGVVFDTKLKKWLVRIGHEGKRYRIGTFECIHEAGKAYNEAALRLHGEFACLNKIKEPLS